MKFSNITKEVKGLHYHSDHRKARTGDQSKL